MVNYKRCFQSPEECLCAGRTVPVIDLLSRLVYIMTGSGECGDSVLLVASNDFVGFDIGWQLS